MNEKNSPVLFIGHGSPMNAILNNTFTQSLNSYPKTIDIPSAIIVFSAHWLTEGTYITGAKHPAQIFDFYGFPDKLYRIKYTPAGLPHLARQIQSDNIGINVDEKRGVDHAAWAILKHIYPNEDIPVLEISLDVRKTPGEHFALAKELIKYRKENILFIGSGNIVHNLQVVDFDQNAKPYEWAVEMDNWLKNCIAAYDIEKLVNYTKYLKDYSLGMPTDEHYLPLLYTLGMKTAEDEIKTIHESVQNGSISMRSLEISSNNK